MSIPNADAIRDAAKTVLLAGTLDTKGPEIAYMRRIVENMGLRTLVMDIGVVDPPKIEPDISREEVCEAAGRSLEETVGLGRRDLIMETMGTGAAAIVRRLHGQGAIHGMAAVGGNQGTSIATTAMKALPLGTPKVMVSTVACGNTRPYIGYTDTAMIFPLADIVGGPNSVTRTILANAAGAIAGMCLASTPIATSQAARVIAVTAFGNLEPAVTRVGSRLKGLGFEAVTFHASGAGGSAMEELVREGKVSGVIDMVTHEVLGELFPDDFYAPVKPGRLTPMVESGVPLVFVPGGLDYFVFGGVSTIPKRCRTRKIHYHNPNNTNVRTTPRELREVAKLVARRLSPGAERVRVLIPKRGWTEFGKAGGPLHDPEADTAFVSSLRRHADPRLSIREVDLHVNDPEFADLCVDGLLEMLNAG